MRMTSTHHDGFERLRATGRGTLALTGMFFLATLGCAPAESNPGGSGGGSVGTGGQGTGGAPSTGGQSGTGGTVGTGGSLVGTGGSGPGGRGGRASGGSGTGTAGSATGGRPAGTAGGTGTGVGGGGVAALGCEGKTYKLCDSFEAGTVGGVPTGWTALRGYGADAAVGVGLANDQFHSGTMALKSNSMTPGQGRVQRSLTALGATAGKHWGRIFYKVQSPAPTPGSGVIHITLTALEGAVENRIVDTVEQSNGTHQWLFNLPDDSCCTGSAYNWRFDAAWHCAEWFVDGTTQTFRFFTDSVEVPQIGFTGRAGARLGNSLNVAVGVIFYQAPPSPFVAWFDDLAIDDNQIGCQ